MGKKPKLLWSGDIVAMTGFARVTENVLKHIDDKDIKKIIYVPNKLINVVV